MKMMTKMKNSEAYKDQLDNVASMKVPWGLFNGYIHPCDSLGNTCYLCEFHKANTINPDWLITGTIILTRGCAEAREKWLSEVYKDDSIA